MSSFVMSIGSVAISSSEVVDNPEDFGIKRSINTKPQEEYQIGRNKVFYPLNIRSDKIIYKYDIELLLSQSKLLDIDRLYKDQLYNKIYNFDIDLGDYNQIFLELDSPLTQGVSKCIIESFEARGSIIHNDILLYKCSLTLIEVII